MISLSNLFESNYFNAITIILLNFFSALINKVLRHSNSQPKNPSNLAVNSLFYHTKFWIKNANKYSPHALDLRRSYLSRKSQYRLKTEPGMSNKMFLQAFSMLINLGSSLYTSMVMGPKPTLLFPGKIPTILAPILQYGLKGNNPPNTISGYGLYILLGFCQTTLVSFIPMAQNIKLFYTPAHNLKQYASLLIVKKHEWECENAEDELIELIDRKL